MKYKKVVLSQGNHAMLQEINH